MKKISRVVSMLGLVALSLNLTSCLKKVTFEEFCTAAKERTKEEYTSVSFSGKVEYKGVTVSMDDTSASWKDNKWEVKGEALQIIVGDVLVAITVDLYTTKEDKSLNYYTGGGFKIEDIENSKSYHEFNSSGYFTVISDGTNTIKASWSK